MTLEEWKSFAATGKVVVYYTRVQLMRSLVVDGVAERAHPAEYRPREVQEQRIAAARVQRGSQEIGLRGRGTLGVPLSHVAKSDRVDSAHGVGTRVRRRSQQTVADPISHRLSI